MRIRAAAAFVCLGIASSVLGQTPVVLEFDPPINPLGGYSLRSWSEDGFLVSVNGSFGTFSQMAPGTSPNRPDNSSAYIQALLKTPPLIVTNVGGSLFSADSVRLAEYSIFAVTQFVTFIGRRPTGPSLTVTFTLDQLIDGPGPNPDFETFTFPSTFTGLSSLEIRGELAPLAYSLDDLQLTLVPSPPVAPVMLAAAALLATRRRR